MASLCSRLSLQPRHRDLIAASGFEFAERQGAPWPAMPPIVRPLVIGSAQLRSSDMARNGSVADQAQLADTKGRHTMTAVFALGLFHPALDSEGCSPRREVPARAGRRVGA